MSILSNQPLHKKLWRALRLGLLVQTYGSLSKPVLDYYETITKKDPTTKL